MLIHRMTATFGKLQGQVLELKDGLNILQAPNETGKSTWCSFLLAMFYGINSRERERAGFIPDKIRYTPWNGFAASGRLECSANGQELCLIRTTRRQTAPMGEFQALHAGTGDVVSGLTGTGCGETLLGVNREVFERSAFIRQSGLAISQDAGLERRIAALITTGEEDTSYSEAIDTLKKQLNRRRYNKNGQIPLLETELHELEQQIAQADDLEHRLAAYTARLESLSAQEAVLSENLKQHDLWDAVQKQIALQDAAAEADRTERAFSSLRQQILDDQIPENETIGRLRGAIVTLENTRKAVEKSRAERDAAAKALFKADAALNESPFAGQTAEEARQNAITPPKVRTNLRNSILAAASVMAAAALATYLFWQHSGNIPILLPVSGAVLSILVQQLILSRSRITARRNALEKRFGTADPDQLSTLAEAYVKLLETRNAAQAEADRCTTVAKERYDLFSENEQAILLDIRRFAPAAFDLSTADEALRECAIRRKSLGEAEAAMQEARMRRDLLAQQTPPAPEHTPSAPPPQDREAIRDKLAAVRAELSLSRSEADQLSGQRRAIGNAAEMRSSAQYLRDQIHALQEEYDAIQLSMTALDDANTILQNRFSPALGQRAAEIFRELTGGKYHSVVLDRAFHLSAETQDDPVYRDAALLSTGAADQLYLATRLAICDLVLPKEYSVPIILDDALASFDDTRCAAALRWLKHAARDRQILLFTCHSREAKFFSGDPEVSVQRLTDRV